MKVKLITDSASDITPEDEKKYGIDIMPFDITLGDESLRAVAYTHLTLPTTPYV